jgi:hypothetical protein
MATRELRFERKVKGLCPDCGKERDRDEFYMCSKCSEMNKRRRQRFKDSGMCVRCGKPAVKGKTQCERCENIALVESKARYKEKRERGICTACGINRPAPKKTMCEMCLAKMAERQLVYLESISDSKKKEFYNKNYAKAKQKRELAKQDGICTKCFKRKATPGYFTCMECRVKTRNEKRERDRRRGVVSYEFCVESGICTHCHRAKATKGKLCDSCYDKVTAQILKAKEKVSTKDHYWMQDSKMAFLAKTARGT